MMDFISCVTVHLGVSQEKMKCSAFESGASNVTKWTKFKKKKILHSIIYFPRTDLGLHPDALEEI